MSNDNNQKYTHNTYQGECTPSLHIKADTKSRSSEQEHIISFEWKIGCVNGSPKGRPPRIRFIVLRHHWDYQIIRSP